MSVAKKAKTSSLDFSKHSKIEGFIAATLTVYKEDGTVDLDFIPGSCKHLVKSGSAGVFVNGTTGEGMTLSLIERKTTLEAWVAAAKELAPATFRVICHVGANSPRDARELAAHAESLGVFACAAQPPSFFKPKSIESLVACLASMASAAPSTPFYYYHIPGLTGVAFPMIKLLKAAHCIPNFVGIKYSCLDHPDLRRCVTFENGRYDILWGSDESAPSAWALGIKGHVGSTYNWYTHIYRQMQADYEAGKQEKVLKNLDWVLKVLDVQQSYPYFSAAKLVMKELGCAVSTLDCRLPLGTLAPEDAAALLQKLNQNNFIARCADLEAK